MFFFTMASKYFSDAELMCHGADQGDCSCGEDTAYRVNPRLLELLDQLRENVGGPLELSCAYRCPAHNAAVGGVEYSQHVLGNAADIIVPDWLTIDQFLWYTQQLPFDGRGVYRDSGFIHCDSREGGIDAGYYWEG